MPRGPTLLREFVRLYATIDGEAFDDERLHVSFDVRSSDDLQALAGLGQAEVTWDPKEEWAIEELDPGDYALDDWLSAVGQLSTPIENRTDIIRSIDDIPDVEPPDLPNVVEHELGIISPDGRPPRWAMASDGSDAFVMLTDTRVRGQDFGHAGRNYVWSGFTRTRSMPMFAASTGPGRWASQAYYSDSKIETIPAHIRKRLLRILGLEGIPRERSRAVQRP